MVALVVVALEEGWLKPVPVASSSIVAVARAAFGDHTTNGAAFVVVKAINVGGGAEGAGGGAEAGVGP